MRCRIFLYFVGVFMPVQIEMFCELFSVEYSRTNKKGGENMSASERRAEIMRILVGRRKCYLSDLAQELGVPKRTIQRDVQTLVLQYPNARLPVLLRVRLSVHPAAVWAAAGVCQATHRTEPLRRRVHHLRGHRHGQKWERLETYSGKLVENLVQATARDLLFYAMKNLSRYFMVGHIHDEIILECPEDTKLEEICQEMARTPDWANGLLLQADGYACQFYKKE